MKKILILVLGVVVLAILIALGVSKSIKDTEKTEDTTPIEQVNEIVDDEEKRELFQFNSFVEDMNELTSGGKYTNKTNGDVISFTLIEDEVPGGKIFSFDVAIDGVTAGQISTRDIGSAEFSPDGKYFAFKTRGECGAACQNHGMYIVDIEKKTVSPILISRPSLSDINSTDTSYQYDGVMRYIQSYEWDLPGSVGINTYVVAVERETGKFYRVSPIEMWSFNLATKESNLVEI